jgi:trehalose/maltose hydrolase-like predicted phosphorylase
MENGVTSEHVGYDGADIKQADVNLLAFPLGVITDKAQMMKDLEYYSLKVPQQKTPAMTQSMFSVICSRCSDPDQAWKWFLDSYRPNAVPPFGVLAEFKGGTNPYFATGAGGTLQAVIFGFAGLDLNPKGGIMQVKEHALPSHWKSLTIKGVGPEKKTYIINGR